MISISSETGHHKIASQAHERNALGFHSHPPILSPQYSAYPQGYHNERGIKQFQTTLALPTPETNPNPNLNSQTPQTNKKDTE
jgi:hypothetical protein